MIKIISKSILIATWGTVFILNAGTIRKENDPILRTQTDPISYKQKLEETKDGIKGAPAPSFTYYEKEGFLVKTPMQTGVETKPKVGSVAETSEVDLGEKNKTPPGDDNIKEGEGEDVWSEAENKTTKEEDDEDWWVEDEGKDQALPPESRN